MNFETLDWKQAAIAWGEGKEIQYICGDPKDGYHWIDVKLSICNHSMTFHNNLKYRIYPPVEAEKVQAEEKARVAETTSSSPKPKSFFIHTYPDSEYLRDKTVALHEENEAFKVKIDEMRLLNKTLDGGRQELKKELAQVKEERDRLKIVWSGGSVLNDKQTTPVRETDDPIKKIMHSLNVFVLHERLEKVEIAIKNLQPITWHKQS